MTWWPRCAPTPASRRRGCSGVSGVADPRPAWPGDRTARSPFAPAADPARPAAHAAARARALDRAGRSACGAVGRSITAAASTRSPSISTAATAWTTRMRCGWSPRATDRPWPMRSPSASRVPPAALAEHRIEAASASAAAMARPRARASRSGSSEMGAGRSAPSAVSGWSAPNLRRVRRSRRAGAPRPDDGRRVARLDRGRRPRRSRASAAASASRCDAVGAPRIDVGDQVLDPELGVARKGIGHLVARPSDRALRCVRPRVLEGDRDPRRQVRLAGSRPASSSAPRTFARRVRRSSAASGKPYHAPFHWSAYFATRPSIRGCLPAIRIGGPPSRIGRGRQLGVLGAVVSALEAHPLTAEEGRQDLETLLEAPDAMVERVAEGVELGLVPSAAEAEDQPPIAHLVELGRHLGGERRVAEREREHERPDLDARRHRRDRGEHGPATRGCPSSSPSSRKMRWSAPHTESSPPPRPPAPSRAAHANPWVSSAPSGSISPIFMPLMLAARMPTGRLPYGRDLAPTRRHPRDRPQPRAGRAVRDDAPRRSRRGRREGRAAGWRRDPVVGPTLVGRPGGSTQRVLRIGQSEQAQRRARPPDR